MLNVTKDTTVVLPPAALDIVIKALEDQPYKISNSVLQLIYAQALEQHGAPKP
jgi:hypothetical protein